MNDYVTQYINKIQYNQNLKENEEKENKEKESKEKENFNENFNDNKRKQSNNYNSFKQSIIDLLNIAIPLGTLYSIIFLIIFLI